MSAIHTYKKYNLHSATPDIRGKCPVCKKNRGKRPGEVSG